MKRLWKSAKLLWAVRAFLKRLEELKMDDKPLLKSTFNWGALAFALIPILAWALPAIGLPELVAPITKILTGVGTLLAGVGVRRFAGKIVTNRKK